MIERIRRTNKGSAIVRCILSIFIAVLCIGSTAISYANNNFDESIITETEYEYKGALLISEKVHDKNGRPSLNSKGYASAKYEYDENGSLIKEEFFGLDGKLLVTNDGYAYAEFTYFRDSNNDIHLLTEDRFDPDGKRIDVPGAFSYRIDTYNDRFLISSEYFDASGKPQRPVGGYAKLINSGREVVQAELDEIGWSADEVGFDKSEYFDEYGNLISVNGGAPLTHGIHTRKRFGVEEVNEIVDTGEAEEEETFSEDSEPKTDNEEEHPEEDSEEKTEEMETDYDELPLFGAYYDADGSPIIGGGHYHKYIKQYDFNGNLTQTDYFDVDGNPIMCNYGYSRECCVYDEKDRLLEVAYYDTEEHLVIGNAGYARVVYEYGDSDSQGDMVGDASHSFDIRESFYDTNGNPVLIGEGYARAAYIYGKIDIANEDGTTERIINRNEVVSIRYYGEDFEPVLLESGYAGVVNVYNDSHQLIVKSFRGTDGNMITNPQKGYASVRYFYDEDSIRNLPVLEVYLDENNNSVKCPDGYSAKAIKRGGASNRQVMSESYWNLDGLDLLAKEAALNHPTVSDESGAHRVDYIYDRYGRVEAEKYFDIAGNPVVSQRGFAAAYSEYNERGSVLWSVSYDQNGKLFGRSENYSAQQHTYDYAGMETSSYWYGESGEPVDQSVAYAYIEREYDPAGKITRETFIDSTGSPVELNGYVSVLREYDFFHRLIKETFADKNGKAVMSVDGYASRCMTYDHDSGQLLKTEYLDAAGNLTMIPSGYAYYEQEQDRNSNLLLKEFYDESGNLVMPESVGYARIERNVDKAGRLISEAYFDESQHLVNNQQGYAEVKYTYCKEASEIVDVEKGVLALWDLENLEGVAKASEFCIAQYYDEAGDATYINGGYSSRFMALDVKGNTVLEIYLDMDGNPSICSEGFAGRIMGYDGASRVNSEKFLNPDGDIITFRNGYSEVRYTYGDSDKVTSVSYFTHDGQPAIGDSGYHEIRHHYGDEEYFQLGYSTSDINSYLKGSSYYSENFTDLRKGHDVSRYCVEEQVFNIYGKPAVVNGKGYSSLKRTVDIRGNVLSERYYNQNGQKSANRNQYYEICNTYDQKSHLLKSEYLGSSGQPFQCGELYYGKSYEYNNQELVAVESFLGPDGELANNIYDFAVIRYEYDPEGRVLKKCFYNKDGALTKSLKAGYATADYDYDPNGRLLLERFTDDSGELVDAAIEYAIHSISYDEETGHVKEEYFACADGSPYVTKEGWSRRELVKEKKTNADGNYVMKLIDERDGEDASDINLTRHACYDRYDHLVSCEYFDSEDNVATCPAGYHKVLYTCSSLGCILTERYFDYAGTPAYVDHASDDENTYSSYAGKNFIYSADGQLMYEFYVDEAGNSVSCHDGYEGKYFEFDRSTNDIDIDFEYYINGVAESVPGINGAYGVKTANYKQTGNYEISFIDQDGQAMDIWNNPNMWGVDYPPGIGEGYSTYCVKCDDAGNIVSESYFDSLGAAALGPDGFSKVERDYDQDGNILNERFLDNRNQSIR